MTEESFTKANTLKKEIDILNNALSHIRVDVKAFSDIEELSSGTLRSINLLSKDDVKSLLDTVSSKIQQKIKQREEEFGGL